VSPLTIGSSQPEMNETPVIQRAEPVENLDSNPVHSIDDALMKVSLLFFSIFHLLVMYQCEGASKFVVF